MSDPLGEAKGATLLSPEEREGLIPSHITLHSELNELEQQNILEAVTGFFSRRRDPLSEEFARALHRRMFNRVWKWAGTYRTSNKNIGPDYWEVRTQLRQVFDDVRYWIEHKTYSPDEIAMRFHRSIVWIHPFPNGNGRWSRLMADMLAIRLGRKSFTWGGSTLRAHDDTRKRYIDALQAADKHDFGPLLAFARS
ncbi:MAG: mobile mystery protein B [Proteobacteria bacterium]|nr:mobile mystery protein B [Pseudomonadota bacterium]